MSAPTTTILPAALSAWRALAVTAVALTGAATSHAQTDVVHLRDGATLRGGEVTAATAAEVTYTSPDGDKKVPSATVRAIEWHSMPETFRLAENLAENGQFGEAATQYLEAAKEALRDLTKAEATFRGARAALRAADTDAATAEAAADRLQEYINDHPDGLRVAEANLLLARALLLQGQPTEAASALQSLESRTVTDGWGMTWAAHAKYHRGVALAAAGEAGQARSAFQSVATAVDGAISTEGADAELGELKERALIAQGETYIVEKDWQQALQYFRRHADSGTRSVQAAALAGVGQALFLSTEGSGEAATLREAQMALARAMARDTSNAETSAKSLYFFGKVLLALGEERERDARNRALTYFDLVTDQYPTTDWAEQARGETQR